MISPYVQTILDDNHFEVVEVLRYGPRFASIRVRHQGRDGLFKMALQRDEQERFRPVDYFWTEHDTVEELDKRLVREALLLQYLSQELRGDFEPQIITLNTETPAWSLRSYISGPSFDRDGSNHAFHENFFASVGPAEVVGFFKHMHQLSPNLPETISALLDPGETRKHDRAHRYDLILEYCEQTRELAELVPAISRQLMAAERVISSRPQVLTHGEPYAPHFFRHNNHIGLIDWENASYHDPVHDLALLYPRLFSNPDWQSEFRSIVESYGYLDGDGLLQWNANVLYQCIFHHQWLTTGRTLGDAAYDTAALIYFQSTIEQLAGI